ncbi:MAG: hypothetical protein KDI36_17835, partial [Pseudomonadales bacterium]|nr:hypothetical protein [Pseudomonadales bacterium]
MSLNLRIFVAYFSVLGIAIYFLLNAFTTEFKPGVRQASEDALLETSNLLAELIAVELQDQPLTDFDFADSAFARAVQQFEA